MIGHEFASRVQGFTLGAPVTMSDLAEIHAELRPHLAVDVTLDVVLRGTGSARDPGPLRVDVIAGRDVCTIIVQS